MNAHADSHADDASPPAPKRFKPHQAAIALGIGVGLFTLVSGILSVEPVLTSPIASTVDGGIDAFVRSAAIELPRGQRVNAVSATVFEEAWDAYGAMFAGATPVPVADAARAYVESIEGDATGQVLRVGY